VSRGHRPSPVLEMPRDMWFCIECSKRWPCEVVMAERRDVPAWAADLAAAYIDSDGGHLTDDQVKDVVAALRDVTPHA